MSASFLVAVLFGLQVQAMEDDSIQVGTCLSPEEIFEIAGVYDGGLYMVGACGDSHLAEGDYEETLACSETNYLAGSWERVVREHDKPGIWWPRPVPCMASVTGAVSEVKRLASKSAEVCSPEDSYVTDYYYERLMTKKVRIGQGELFLPDPLAVIHNTYGYDAEDGHIEETCTQTFIRGTYRNLTSIEIQKEVLEGCPGQAAQESCTAYTLGQGRDSQGNSCALVKALSACEK